MLRLLEWGCVCHASSLAPNERAAPREHFRFRKLAELSHGDPAQGERGRVVPKRDLLQRSQRVAGFEWPLFHRCKRIQLTS